ncbi:hypothetical protein AV530_013668 [Patagioenas fasciata monilis]|uniref:Uncharacterized protein n=1 Tax=Patagioenas fasciata monilis TaxID=372326 RepID=A0A1V4J7P5_PATFA|nr:hypothetical protein AV530_013668 [Patagioenas fasciata monilis]
MGGIFGKNKRLSVFPKRVALYKAKAKKTSETVRMFCDASTWTGENHVHSARIGRTPKGPELSAAKLVLDAPESESAAQAERERGKQAASLRAQQTEAPIAVTAGDAQNVEVSEKPEAKPTVDVKQHQELVERRAPQGQEGRQSEAVLHPSGSWAPNEQLGSEDHQVTLLTQTTVKAEVHVSADVQGGPGKVHSDTVESELLAGTEQEAGVVSAAEETCVEKTHQEAPVQKAADSPAPSCAVEESELPLKPIETREDNTSVRKSEEEQVCCAAKAPPDLQLEPDTEAPNTEDMEGNAFEPEQAEALAEVCDDGQTSKESK